MMHAYLVAVLDSETVDCGRVLGDLLSALRSRPVRVAVASTLSCMTLQRFGDDLKHSRQFSQNNTIDVLDYTVLSLEFFLATPKIGIMVNYGSRCAQYIS